VAARPDVTVVPDRAALQAYLSTQLVHFATPLVVAMRTRSPLGPRALWGTVADNVASAVLWLSGEFGVPDTGHAEVTALLVEPPLRGKTGCCWSRIPSAPPHL
jgi:hypothetical protein